MVENVVGMLSDTDGFSRLSQRIAGCGFRPGALAIDAVQFVPGTRRRVLVVAVRNNKLAAKAAPLDFSGALAIATAIGTSRQILVEVFARRIRLSEFTPGETARLMGVAKAFGVPDTIGKAVAALGDALAVPS